VAERWTDATLEALKQAILDQAPNWVETFPEGNTGQVVGVPDAAVVALRWLADVGLLLPPGGETQEQWGYRRAPLAGWIDRCCTDPSSCQRGRGHTHRRTAYAGPWFLVDNGETKP
jgi:hypothetical protein